MANVNGRLIYVSNEAYDRLTKLAKIERRPKGMQVELLLDYYEKHHSAEEE